jgi:hypothetical protein
VEAIDPSAFANCKSLKEVTFAAGSRLKTIHEKAFSQTGLRLLEIPASVETVGPSAFANCKSLKEVTLAVGSRLTTIQEKAFSDCESLETVVWRESIVEIGAKAFYRAGLRRLEIPASVEEIGPSAFDDCESLEEVSFGFGSMLTTIGSRAFYSESSRVVCSLPDFITADLPVIFGQTPILSSVSVRVVSGPPSSPSIFEISAYGVLVQNWFLGDPSALRNVRFDSCPLVGIGEGAFRGFPLIGIVIPNSVRRIGPFAFADCKSLETVTLGKSVTEIADHAFSRTGLLRVEIPDSMRTIGPFAFADCESLETVTFRKSLLEIGRFCFCNCKKLKLTTPLHLSLSIGEGAFSGTAFQK